MKKISKFLLFTIVLLVFSLGTISAAEDGFDSSQSADVEPDTITETNVIGDTIAESSTKITNQKTIEKNEINNENRSVKQATTLTVTSSNYENFFQYDEGEGIIKTTDFIRNGDILNLKGTFNDVDFSVDKSITLTSLNNNAYLYNCTVRVTPSGSGSTISNLIINNSAETTSGILVNDAENLTVENNIVEVSGLNSYAFEANMNHSMIKLNSFETHKLTPETERTHTAFVICDSNYNIIANNTIKSDGANCVYLSSYPGVDIHAGPSNYNIITGNNISAANSAWSYSIQIMGSKNNVSKNYVSGGYKGISTQGSGNIITENDVDAENQGILAADNSVVVGNYVHTSGSSTGIAVDGNNVLIANNTIITQNGPGIDIFSDSGSNSTLSGNNITSNNYGIYSKGEYTHVIIENNRVTSQKEGILFKQKSRNKKMNHIFVSNNNIKSDADYAINFNETGSLTVNDVNVTVTQSNVLTSANGVGIEVAYLPPGNVNSSTGTDSNQTIIITSSNYTSWFENGIAKDTVEQNATVYLRGTFNNLNFNFPKKVHVIGENCLINNGTISLTQDAHQSTITNVTINNKYKEDFNVHGIEIYEVNNCKITNVNIANYGQFESLGIFAYSSNGNRITNCTINTSGDYVNNGIFLYASDTNTLENNIININQSNESIPYTNAVQFNEKIGTITEILHNHGIVLVYSSDNTINKNKVNATSMFKSYVHPEETCQNSIVGIDVYFESHNNQVTNNNISINSYAPFSYGMGVLGGQWGTSMSSSNAANNIYQYNNVTVRGGYFATGFIAGRNSINTIVDSNIFKIEARKNSSVQGDYSFGVTLENSTKSNITNNQFAIKGASVYGMELFDSGNNTIFNNTLFANATYPYAIAGYSASNNNILNNTLMLKKGNYGTITPAAHADAIPYGDEAIMFMTSSNSNTIKFNHINTTANTTVKLGNQTSNNIVTENSLVAKTTIGDQSVINQHSSNNVSNNFVYFVNATVDPVEAFVGDTITLVANINTTATDYSNLSVSFRLGSNNIGNSPVVNGKASLDYNVSTLWNPTTYQITAFVSGNNFQNVTALSQAVFEKHPEKTTVKVAKVLGVVGSNVVLTANVTTTSGGKIGSGAAEFYIDDVLLDVVDLRLGVASCNYTIANNAENIIHTIKVNYLGTNDYENATGNNTLGVQSHTTVVVSNCSAVLGENVNVRANVTSGGKALASGIAKVYVNNVPLTNASISNGVVNVNVKVPTSFDKGNYTLKVVFDGNDTVSGATATAKIVLNPMAAVLHFNDTWVDLGENSSLVLAIDNGASGSDLCLANGGNVSVKLNNQLLKDSNGNVIYGVVNNGKLTFKFVAPSQLEGSQNLTFIFDGNSKFSAANKTFPNSLNIGKINVTITVNEIGTVNLNDNITVTGKFTETTGKAIANSNVKIIINGVKNYAKTDKNGTYVFVTTASTSGVNNLSVGYSGNNKYRAYEYNTTFTVGKQNVIVTYDPVMEVPAGTNVTITGKFTDDTGKAISNSNVRVFVNGVKYLAKTDKNGKYNLSVLVTKVGVKQLE